ncbi:MAG: ATP synthase F1 subunit delta [Ruminococcus sp.]|nr:ATP synthase F1 subunit delta [Ruminococcus sp.]
MAECVESVYSEAFFELSLDADCVDRSFEELESVCSILNTDENKDFVSLLASPLIKDDDKRKALTDVFGGRISQLTLDFLSVVAKNGRIVYLPAMFSQFKALYCKHKNILEVTAVTSVKMSASLREKLIGKLEAASGCRVDLVEKLDPAILGGIVLRYRGTEIDASVASGLERIKAQIDGVIA